MSLIFTPHQYTLAIRVLTQDFISASHFWISLKLSVLSLTSTKLSLSVSLTLHSLNPDYASTTLSTSTLALCLSLNPVDTVSHLPNSDGLPKTKKKWRHLRSWPPNTRTLFDPDQTHQRESKGWGLERIGCLSENLMLFRPRSEKVRVRVWRESG